MAEAPETIDIFSARPGDIVIYGGYSSSEALRVRGVARSSSRLTILI